MKKITFITLLIIIGLSSCSESNNSNKLDSDEFEIKEERIKALKNEITSKSDFDNAEFELFNVNGFSNSRTTVPGASSWDYKFVIKVKTFDIDKWTEGMIKVEPKDYKLNWTKEITKGRLNDWTIKSTPEFYTRKGDNVMMIVYRTDRIIFKRVINN